MALVAAPPIDAAPWQDLSHLGAAVGGLLASRAGIPELRNHSARRGGWLLVVSLLLLVATIAFGLPLNLEAMGT